jgi:hypothetical protein
MLKKKHLMSADGVAVFLLGAVFLFLSVGLVLLGSSVYRHVVADSQENDRMRTTLSYIANQVRRSDVAGNVRVGKFHGQDALLLLQDLDGIECVTYLYCWEGSLRELFVEKGYELEPEAGLALIPLDNIFFALSEEGLINVEALFNGGSRGRLVLAPRSWFWGGDGL